jgi:hypothetical protein
MAHLSSSLNTPLDASYWLQCNWLQPPLRAPEWVINWGLHKDWPFKRAILEYKQAAGLIPPLPLRRPILTGGFACQEATYQHWKRVVDKLWEDKRHCQQAAARQCHLDKEAARQWQEANRCQQLLDEHATYNCQEAAPHQQLLDEVTARPQCLLDKEAACCLMAERNALARQMAATQTIFLWLCCHCLHVQLARQTLRWQQRKAALAHLQYKQDCCLRAALTEKQHWQAATAQVKALANKTTKQCCHEAAAREKMLANEATKHCCHKAAARKKAFANKANKQRCQESAKRAVALA